VLYTNEPHKTGYSVAKFRVFSTYWSYVVHNPLHQCG
jgi:hypothetical protein